MFTFNISIAVLLSAALLLSEKKLQVEADACYSNLGCSLNYYCCKRYSWQSSVCRYYSCVGQSCSSNSDCGGTGESCLNNVCTTSECSSSLKCGLNEYCCKQRYSYQKHVCRFNCVSQPCNSDSDCGGPGECCSSSKYCTKSSCDECSSNSDCTYNKYCCKQRYLGQSHVCGSGGCVGQSCHSGSDCGGPGECCSSTNYCTKSGCDGCSSNSDCTGYKYCCKQRYSYQKHVCRSSCVSQSCNSDSDCGGPGECCSSSKYCTKSSCDECYSDSDCGGPGECCSSSNYCTTSSCRTNRRSSRSHRGIPSWFIPVCVVSGVVGLAILVACIYGVMRAMRGRVQPGIVVGQQQTGATVLALQNTQTAESNPEQLQMPPPPAYFNQGQDRLPADSQPVAQVTPPAYAKY